MIFLVKQLEKIIFAMEGNFTTLGAYAKPVYVTLEGKPDNQPYIHDKDGFWAKASYWSGGTAWDFANTWDWNSETELPILRDVPGVQRPQIRN